MSREIQISTGDPVSTAKNFIEVWNRLEAGEQVGTEQHIVFENPETLFETLTPARWTLLKALRTGGPMDVQSLAIMFRCEEAEIDEDVSLLEHIGLITRTAGGLAEVRWDIVETRLRLAA